MSPGLSYLLGLVLGLFTGLGHTYLLNNDWKRQTIRRGCAEYHPITGEWKWKEPPP